MAKCHKTHLGEVSVLQKFSIFIWHAYFGNRKKLSFNLLNLRKNKYNQQQVWYNKG